MRVVGAPQQGPHVRRVVLEQKPVLVEAAVLDRDLDEVRLAEDVGVHHHVRGQRLVVVLLGTLGVHAQRELVLPAEFAKAQEAGVKTAYAELDKDGDGKLSKEEYAVVLGEDCE